MWSVHSVVRPLTSNAMLMIPLYVNWMSKTPKQKDIRTKRACSEPQLTFRNEWLSERTLKANIFISRAVLLHMWTAGLLWLSLKYFWTFQLNELATTTTTTQSFHADNRFFVLPQVSFYFTLDTHHLWKAHTINRWNTFSQNVTTC